MTQQRDTVIVVDDSDEIRDLLTQLLEDEGYRVLAVEDGETALIMARRARPSLITLDLALPGENGEEVLRQLKADPETSGIPVLVVSGTDDAAERLRAAGAGGVLAKPFPLDEMQRLARALIAEGR
jgi:DNA-binding response OmpR family regulator